MGSTSRLSHRCVWHEGLGLSSQRPYRLSTGRSRVGHILSSIRGTKSQRVA